MVILISSMNGECQFDSPKASLLSVILPFHDEKAVASTPPGHDLHEQGYLSTKPQLWTIDRGIGMDPAARVEMHGN